MDFPNSVIPDMLQPSSLMPEPLPTLNSGSGILDIVNGPSGNFSTSEQYDPMKEMNFNRRASSTAMAAPLSFDPVGTRLDRYTNSQYFGQLGFNPLEGYGNEYKYGSVQSWGDVWGNALGGAWKLASNTYVEGWKGWGKLAEALGTWDSSKLTGSPEELLEQSKIQEDIMNKYAIFSTPESDSGGLFNRKMFGDMVQQSGFALGTIGQFVTEELLTMGLSTEFSLAKLGISAPKWLGRVVSKADVVADMAKQGDVLVRSDRFVNSLVNGAKKFVPLVGTADDIARYSRAGAGALQLAAIGAGGVRRMLGEANMAFTEARMEAAGTYGELYNHLYDEELRRTGEIPSGEKLARMKQLSYDAATDNFGVNAGLLMLTNRLQFDNLFTKFDFGRKILGEAAGYADDVLTVAGKDLTKTYVKGRMGTIGLFGDIAKDFGRKTAAWEATKSIGSKLFKWETSEGLQEILQEGSNLTLQKYYYDLYHGAKGTDLEPYIKAAAKDLGQNNYGLKTFLMGALTGRLLSPINFAIGQAKLYGMTTKEERDQRNVDIKETVDLINAFYQDPNKFLNEHIANVKIQNRVATSMDEAIANRDQYRFKNFKDSGFARTVSAAIKTNMFEPMMQTLKTFSDKMDAKEFKEAFGMEMTDDNVASVKDFFGKVANSAEEFHENWKSLKDRYADLVIPELYKDGTPERKVANYAKKALDEAIEIMATLDFKSKRAIERVVDLQTQMAAIPNIGSTVEMAFRVLSDSRNVDQEITLLSSELAGLEANENPDKATKKLIKTKKAQIDALQRWLIGYSLKNAEDKDIRSLFRKRDFNKAFRDYVNSKNEEKEQKEVTVKQTDFTKIYDSLMDYMQLYSDHDTYIDAFNTIATPTQFGAFHDRIIDAIMDAGTKFNNEHIQEAEIIEEGGDLSKLLESATEDESANIESPEGEEVKKEELNVEALQNDLEMLYKQHVEDQKAEGLVPNEPNSFLRFNSQATKLLAKYGLSYKDVYPVTSDTDPNEVKFVYGKKPEKVVTPAPDSTADEQTTTTTETPETETQTVNVGGTVLGMGDIIQPGPGEPEIKIIGFGADNKVTVVTQDQMVDVPMDMLQQVLNNGYSTLVKNKKNVSGSMPATQVNRRNLQTNPRKKFVNGQVIDVAKTRSTTLNQSNTKDGLDADIEKKNSSVVSRKKVRNGYTKVNNTFFITRTKTAPGKETTLTREGINPNYPMVMATSKISTGYPLVLRVDTGLASYDEYQYLNSDVKTKKTKADYFDKDGKIKAEAESEFPVAIYAVVDGKEVKLGYLPQEKWVTQTYENGESKNIVDEYTQGGEVVDNRAINIDMIRKVRKDIMNKFNNENIVEFSAVVSQKSDGTLMTDSKLRKLTEVFHPDTQLAIIKNGVPYIGLNEPLTENEDDLILPSQLSQVFADKNSLNGWPMVIINTPNGRKLVSWVSVPTLNAGQQDFILEAWKAFHKLNSDNKANKKHDTKSEQYKIVDAVYNTYGSKLETDEAPDFKLLQDYINDYITFTSSEMKYDPLKPNTSQITVLPDGTLITWAVETQKEENDKLMLKSPSQLTQENQNKFYNLAALVYYNVKFTDKKNTGINSDKKMQFLSVVGGKLVKSQPMTYNEHIFNILETNLSPGIPVDQSDPKSPFIHFANPVINFEFTGEEKKGATSEKTQQKPDEKSPETSGLTDLLLGAEFGEGITDFGEFDPGLLGDLEGNKKSIATRVDDARQDNQIRKEC